MGKLTSGPGWIEIEAMIRAINALHSGEAGLTILARGAGSSGGLSVAASMLFDVLPGSSLPPSVAVIKDWPCTAHADFSAHAFALLYELDNEISKVYQNEALWK